MIPRISCTTFTMQKLSQSETLGECRICINNNQPCVLTTHNNPRPLPSTSQALVGGEHQRSASHSAAASSSSVYEDESMNGSGHFRSLSDNTPGSRLRPLPSTLQHKISASSSVSSLSNQLYPNREDLSVRRVPSGGSPNVHQVHSTLPFFRGPIKQR